MTDIPSPQPVDVPLVVKTAPARIWLQVSDDREHNDKPFPASTHGDEVTWCQDKVLDCEVEYIRADVAAELIEIVRMTIGNVRSLGPAGALASVHTPYREWLAQLEAAYAKATGAQA